MPVTNSETSIANLALAEISSHEITNLADDTTEARWCNRFYGQCRDEMLRAHPWNFAMKRANLTQSVTTPVNEWSTQFELPADFISLYQLNGFTVWGGTNIPLNRNNLFQIEAGALLTNCETATVRYVFQQTDATTFDPLFVTALSLLLASKIAKPITGNDGTAWTQRYEGIALPRAMKYDAREDKPHVISPLDSSELIRRRYVSDITS